MELEESQKNEKNISSKGLSAGDVKKSNSDGMEPEQVLNNSAVHESNASDHVSELSSEKKNNLEECNNEIDEDNTSFKLVLEISSSEDSDIDKVSSKDSSTLSVSKEPGSKKDTTCGLSPMEKVIVPNDELQCTPKESPSKDSGGRKRRKSLKRSPESFWDEKDLEHLRKPFKLGWKREIVYRNTVNDGGNVQSDVYYFPPVGKKLRSLVEIAGYLESKAVAGLNLTHFTFRKKKIHKPPEEIERRAGKSHHKSVDQTPESDQKMKHSKDSKEKKTPLVKESPVCANLQKGPSSKQTKPAAKPNFMTPNKSLTTLQPEKPSKPIVVTQNKSSTTLQYEKPSPVSNHVNSENVVISANNETQTNENHLDNQRGQSCNISQQPKGKLIKAKKIKTMTTSDLNDILGHPSDLIASIVSQTQLKRPAEKNTATPEQPVPKMKRIEPSVPNVRTASSSTSVVAPWNKCSLTCLGTSEFLLCPDCKSLHHPICSRMFGYDKSGVKCINCSYKNRQNEATNSSQSVLQSLLLPQKGINTTSEGSWMNVKALHLPPSQPPLENIKNLRPPPLLHAVQIQLQQQPMTNCVGQILPPPPPLLHPGGDVNKSNNTPTSSVGNQTPKNVVFITLAPGKNPALNSSPQPFTILSSKPSPSQPQTEKNNDDVSSNERKRNDTDPSAKSISSYILPQSTPLSSVPAKQMSVFPPWKSKVKAKRDSSSELLINLEESITDISSCEKSTHPAALNKSSSLLPTTISDLQKSAQKIVFLPCPCGNDTANCSSKPCRNFNRKQTPTQSQTHTVFPHEQPDSPDSSTTLSISDDDIDMDLPVSFEKSSIDQVAQQIPLNSAESSDASLHAKGYLATSINVLLHVKNDEPEHTPSNISFHSEEADGCKIVSSASQKLKIPSHMTGMFKFTDPVMLKINNKVHTVPVSCITTSSKGDVELTIPPGSVPAANDPSVITLIHHPTSLAVRPETLQDMKSDGNSKRRNYLQSLCLKHFSYSVMMNIFRHLSVQDLLRLSMVCKDWRNLVLQPCLWYNVYLSGVTITNWQQAATFFNAVKVKKLNLENLYILENSWNSIAQAIPLITNLEHIIFNKIPAFVLETLTKKMPTLVNICAGAIFEDAQPMLTIMPTEAKVSQMILAVDQVHDGKLNPSDAAAVFSVPEKDLVLLTQPNISGTELTADEENAILLACMRLSQLGYSVDRSSLVMKCIELFSKKYHKEELVPAIVNYCSKIFYKNMPLLNVTNKHHCCLRSKLEDHFFQLYKLYENLNMKDVLPSQVLVLDLKIFTISLDSRIVNVTGLSLMSPDDDNGLCPVMLICPISAILHHPDLIMAQAKHGMATSQLVSIYISKILAGSSTRPKVIVTCNHANLFNADLVSSCISDSVYLHSVSADVANFVFPGCLGGPLQSIKSYLEAKPPLALNKFLEFFINYLKNKSEIKKDVKKSFNESGLFPIDPNAPFKYNIVKNADLKQVQNCAAKGECQVKKKILLENNTSDSCCLVAAADVSEKTSQEKADVDGLISCSSKMSKGLSVETSDRILPETPKTKTATSCKLYNASVLLKRLADDVCDSFNTVKIDALRKSRQGVNNGVGNRAESSTVKTKSNANSNTSTRSAKANAVKMDNTTVTGPRKVGTRLLTARSKCDIHSRTLTSRKFDKKLALLPIRLRKKYFKISRNLNRNASPSKNGTKQMETNFASAQGKESKANADLLAKKSTIPNNEDESPKLSLKTDVRGSKNIVRDKKIRGNETVTSSSSGNDQGNRKNQTRKLSSNIDTSVNILKINRENKTVAGLWSGDEQGNLPGEIHQKNKSNLADRCKKAFNHSDKVEKKKLSKTYNHSSIVRKEKVCGDKLENDCDVESIESLDSDESSKRDDLSDESLNKFIGDVFNEGVGQKVVTEMIQNDFSYFTGSDYIQQVTLSDHDYFKKSESEDQSPYKGFVGEREETASISESDKEDSPLANVTGNKNLDKENKTDKTFGSSNTHIEDVLSDSSDTVNDKTHCVSSDADSDSEIPVPNKASGESGSCQTDSKGESFSYPIRRTNRKIKKRQSSDVSDFSSSDTSSDSSVMDYDSSNEEEEVEADNDDEGEEGESKCHICFKSYPPHSKEKVINWVDCDYNCGRWFHVVCVTRTQPEADPAHYICTLCKASS